MNTVEQMSAGRPGQDRTGLERKLETINCSQARECTFREGSCCFSRGAAGGSVDIKGKKATLDGQDTVAIKTGTEKTS